MKNKIIFILLFISAIIYSKTVVPISLTALPKNAQEFIERVYPQIG